MALLRIGISSCVVGGKVRFDGGQAKMPTFLKSIANDIEFVPFCPEVAAGMSVPRETVRLIGFENAQGETQQVRMVGNKSASDYTEALTSISKSYIESLKTQKLSGYIVKSKSPSCGMQSAKLYDEAGNLIKKTEGIFTRILLEEMMIPVIEAEMLNSPEMADRFLLRVMLADAFYQLPETGLRKQDLTNFYAEYKLLLMAYSPAHYREAGKLLGDLQSRDLQAVKKELYAIMFAGFAVLSSRERHTNALMHVQGYFKKFLQSHEKKELSQVIGNYHQGKLPLSVPMTLLKHHLLIHPNAYLSQQKYFMPYSDDYGLRNHL